MTLSTRYAVPLAIVLAIALVPTLIHSYGGATLDDGRYAKELRLQIEGAPGVPTARKADWVKRRLSSDDWMERRYTAGGRQVGPFVGRSSDPKALYHHPELALAYGRDLAPRGIVQVGQISAHALHATTGEPALVLYALHANDTFVVDPIRFQIRSLATHLFSGQPPMTLFFVVQEGPADADDLSKTAAARVLKTAVDAFTGGR